MKGVVSFGISTSVDFKKHKKGGGLYSSDDSCRGRRGEKEKIVSLLKAFLKKILEDYHLQ